MHDHSFVKYRRLLLNTKSVVCIKAHGYCWFPFPPWMWLFTIFCDPKTFMEAHLLLPVSTGKLARCRRASSHHKSLCYYHCFEKKQRVHIQQKFQEKQEQSISTRYISRAYPPWCFKYNMNILLIKDKLSY